MDDVLFSATDQHPPRRVVGRPYRSGESGNPGGRPKATTSDGRSLVQLCRDFSEDAIRTLHAVATDLDAPLGLRVQAAEAILRRGWADKPRVDPNQQRSVVVVTIDADDPRYAQLQARQQERQQ